MRAAEIRALADRAGIAPGVSVLDLCCGVAGPGRFITRELGCTYLGVDSSSSAIDIARERAGDLPCRFEVSRIPPIPPGPFDVVLLLETMLAFPDKETLLQEISRALDDRRAVRLHPGGGRAPHGGRSESACPTPTRSGSPRCRRCSRAWSGSGCVVRWQDDCSRSHRAMADSLIDAFAADATDIAAQIGRRGAGRAAGRPPALERLAARRTGPQDRFRRREDVDAALSSVLRVCLLHHAGRTPTWTWLWWFPPSVVFQMHWIR